MELPALTAIMTGMAAALGHPVPCIIGGDTVYLIEINPRLQGTTALSVAAGVNFPWLSVLLALGVRPGDIADQRCRFAVRGGLGHAG